jgi:uncharacterized protein
MAGNGPQTESFTGNEATEATQEKENFVMPATENKKLLQEIFAELAKGNSRPFVENMADDFSWTITGTTQWSKKYAGKRAVIEELFGGLRATLAPPILVEAVRFIADGDYVAVEARGKNTTKAGVPYNNSYCYVFHLTGGKLRAMTEYLDTELVTKALGAPVANSAANN